MTIFNNWENVTRDISLTADSHAAADPLYPFIERQAMMKMGISSRNQVVQSCF
jgi:hypothetical protein